MISSTWRAQGKRTPVPRADLGMVAWGKLCAWGNAVVQATGSWKWLRATWREVDYTKKKRKKNLRVTNSHQSPSSNCPFLSARTWQPTRRISFALLGSMEDTGASLGWDSDSHLLQGRTDGHSDVGPCLPLGHQKLESTCLLLFGGMRSKAPLCVWAPLFSPNFPPLAFRDNQFYHRQMWQRKCHVSWRWCKAPPSQSLPKPPCHVVTCVIYAGMAPLNNLSNTMLKYNVLACLGPSSATLLFELFVLGKHS